MNDADDHDDGILLPMREAHPPGEPAMQTASVDIDDHGRVVSSPVRAYHLTGRCYEDARAAESTHRSSRRTA